MTGPFSTYHLIAGQPVAFLFDAGLGAFAADGQRLHDQAVLHGQAQLPGRLLRVHAKHPAQVPVQVERVSGSTPLCLSCDTASSFLKVCLFTRSAMF